MREIIFDVDGTLLDSMAYWRTLAREYAESKNVQLPENFDERTYTMTLDECGTYFHEELGIEESPEQMKAEVIDLISQHYEYDMPMKPGMKELLVKEKQAGSRMCIFTTSDKSCVEKAMKRLGVRDYFEHIYTVYDIGITKQSPDSYKKICALMGFCPENTYVYEDVIHAVKSATKAGCKVIAVYDEESAQYWPEISGIAIDTIRASE